MKWRFLSPDFIGTLKLEGQLFKRKWLYKSTADIYVKQNYNDLSKISWCIEVKPIA